MRPKIAELFTKTFRQDVYLVGGGASLKDFDFDRLKDKVTVAINSSYMKLPNATVLYWCDSPWAATNYDSLKRHPCKLRFCAQFNVIDRRIDDNEESVGEALLLRRTGEFGIDVHKDNVRGNHSGAHCLNLIGNMRPNRVILLGFDLNQTNRKTHWHDFQTVPVTADIYSDNFLPCINSMAAPLKKLGIKVINCSIESAIMCFEKDTIENYL